MSPPRGVLLINLGTPDAPNPRAVRRYLREFLSDPRVIDLPALQRKLLLEAVILPTRPRASAAAYAKVWSEAGSPLLVHGEALRAKLALRLGPDYAVALGMRYGRPALSDALRRLEERGVHDVIALPLFPQYSTAATGSALAALFEAPAAGRITRLTALGPFWDDPGFARAWRDVAAPLLAPFRADHVLFSYHGLPENQIRAADRSGAHCLARADCCASLSSENRDCYRAQCFATTAALGAALELDPRRVSTSFQSRLGRRPWIKPYTDLVLPELHAAGVRRLAVLCPAFVADCLETVEEIGIRAREQWRALGGEDLLLVPCLNAHPSWVDAVAELVLHATGAASSTRDAATNPDASELATLTPAT
jgi:ferrochelatase